MKKSQSAKHISNIFKTNQPHKTIPQKLIRYIKSFPVGGRKSNILRNLFYHLPITIQNIILGYLRVISRGPKVPAPVSEKGPWTHTLFPLTSTWEEVIFAPFHDPTIATGLPVSFSSINAQRCSLQHFWCWTNLLWESCPSVGDAASLRLETDLSYPQYDKMLFCLSMIPETSIRFEFEVDGKIYKHDEVFWGTGSRLEICIPAPKGHICAIYMIISTKYKFEQMLSLSWFGLQNSSLVKQLQTSIQKYDSSWTGLIKPLDNWEDIHFQVGLLFNETDLEKLREKRLYPGWSDHYRYLEEKATIYMNRHPEADLTAFLPTDDRRYIRESENDRTPYHFEALVLGFVGIINDDKQMMQHALRYLMSMLHTENWVQSAEQKLTGSTWSTRCFMEEMTTTSVVLLADWYAFALTDRAKDLVRQCIWDKGLAIIDRDMMKHDYMHRINQGAWFCRAGILGGLYLENAWPHMGRYVNAKFGTMNKILKRYIMRDGGVDEGIGYFCMTAQAVIPALVAYARSRGKSTHRIINRYFKKADNYLSTLSSFEPGKGSVDGDCRTENFCGDIVPVLAGLFPGSICNDILHQCIQNRSIYNVTGSLINSGGLIGFVYGPDKIKVSKPIVSTFNIMPKSGFAVSARKSGTHSLRILFSGSKPNPSSHAHYDKGAFTVEADGTDVFVDRGMLQYDDPRALLAKCSRMHNVITPYLPNGSYPDQNLPEKRVCPKGSGNEQQVELTLDLAEVWKEYMSSYQRHIISDSVEKIIITDHGTLKKRGRVAFHLHSGVKFDLDAYKAVGTVNSMTFEVTAKWADEILHFEDSLSFDGRALHHLVFHSKELETFSIETTISVKRDSQPTIQMI